MTEGKIYKALSGFYYVESDGSVLQCRARGKLRLEKRVPLVGDNVYFEPIGSGKGLIKEILLRKNEFQRPPIANIDLMVIIASSVPPVTDPYLIDRMTVIAGKNNCESLICINKCDLDPANELFDTYNKSGFKTIKTSAVTGQGISDLIDSIRNFTCAFTGNSGVGKSSILNRIEPDFNIKTDIVSKKLGRGKHTTRHVELYKLSCGTVIADTPGFSSFDMEFIASKDEIQYLFSEFSPFLTGCRFDDCAHINEPDCVIRQAMQSGKIAKSRYASYVRLYNQANKTRPYDKKQ